MPSIEHILYIPGILLVGLAFGFRLGAGAARGRAHSAALVVAASSWRRVRIS